MSILDSIPALPLVVPCLRCNYPCHIIEHRNDTPILAGSGGPQGVCSSCQVTAFLQDERAFPAIAIIQQRGRDALEMLRTPEWAAQFGTIVATLGATDIPASQIDWERVIINWDLPHPKAPKARKRK